jgi:flagellar protein FlaG
MTDPIQSLEPTAAAPAAGRFGVAGDKTYSAAVPVLASAVNAAEADVAVPTDPRALHEAVRAAVQELIDSGTALSYRVDKELDRVIVEVRDRVSGEVLRQIPGEEVLRMARNLKSGVGALLNATV